MKPRDIITTPRVQEMRREKKQARIVRLIIIGTITIVVLIGLILVSRLNSLRINSILVEGTQVLDATEIESLVHDELQSAFLWLIPKDNTFIYPRKKILFALQKKFPRIETISIVKDSATHLIVSITEREGIYLWCGGMFPEPENTQCYFMDKVGYVFAEAPYFSGTVYFKWYGGNRTDESPIGHEIISDDTTLRVGSFIRSIQGLGLKPYAIDIQNNESFGTIYISRVNDAALQILFSIHDDLFKIFDNLSSARYTDPLKTIATNGFKNISYIDLRYENKVYYK